jgi:hypothetical protein
LNFKVKDYRMGGGWIYLPPFSPTSNVYLSKNKHAHTHTEEEERTWVESSTPQLVILKE